jgi:hypothetical protein
MQHNLSTCPFTKWHDSTEKFVDPVSMSICGNAQVDDHASKGMGDWGIIKAETLAVLLNGLVVLWQFLLKLQDMISFDRSIRHDCKLTLGLTKFITGSTMLEMISYSSMSFWISAEGLGMRCVKLTLCALDFLM